MRGLVLAVTAAALALTLTAPVKAQELLMPGVYIEELSVQLPGGETTRGSVRLAPPEGGTARTLAPNGRGRVPNSASIEVPPGVLQRTLRRAYEQELRFRASFSGRDARGQYYTTAVGHGFISAFRPGGAGSAHLVLASGDGPGPVVECSADACTGPAEDFLFLYHCIVNRHAYVPAQGGGRQATCTLRPSTAR